MLFYFLTLASTTLLLLLLCRRGAEKKCWWYSDATFSVVVEDAQGKIYDFQSKLQINSPQRDFIVVSYLRSKSKSVYEAVALMQFKLFKIQNDAILSALLFSTPL